MCGQTDSPERNQNRILCGWEVESLFQDIYQFASHERSERIGGVRIILSGRQHDCFGDLASIRDEPCHDS